MRKKFMAVLLCSALVFGTLTSATAAENTVSDSTVSESAIEAESTEEATEEASTEENTEISENEVSENEVSENEVSENDVDVEAVVEDATASGNSTSGNGASGNSAFYISAKNCKWGDKATFIMGEGTKLKFKIVDAEGKKIKGADKTATFAITSGDTTDFTVNKSTVALSKNAQSLGEVGLDQASNAVLSVTYNNVTEQFMLVAGQKIKSVGFIPNSRTFKSAATVTVSLNSTVDLQKLNELTGRKIFAAYKVTKGGFMRTFHYYAYLEEFTHSTTPNKKAVKNGNIKYDSNGNALTFSTSTPGVYAFTYRTSDTGKTFTLKLKVK